MTRVLVKELDTSRIVVAPCDNNHHLPQTLSLEILSKITKDGTIAIFISSSLLLKEICRLNYDSGQLMVGSSANLSGGGQKFHVGDIEDRVKDAVNLIVDYGLQRYHIYIRASLIMDFGQMKVYEWGPVMSCSPSAC